jgi:hypothetical protein
MFWRLHPFNRSQFMGEMIPLFLLCLFHLSCLQVLQYTPKHVLPLITPFLLHILPLLHLHLLLLLPLVPSASDIPETSGCQRNGLF